MKALWKYFRHNIFFIYLLTVRKSDQIKSNQRQKWNWKPHQYQYLEVVVRKFWQFNNKKKKKKKGIRVVQNTQSISLFFSLSSVGNVNVATFYDLGGRVDMTWLKAQRATLTVTHIHTHKRLGSSSSNSNLSIQRLKSK